MKCNYCEYEVSEECKCCPNCGEDPKTRKKNKIKEEKAKGEKTIVKSSIDTANLYPLWGVIGFFIPFVGIILFVVWIKTKPKEAKAAGIGALGRIALLFFYFILIGIIHFVASKY